MVSVGTSLHASGVVLHWASTIETGRRSAQDGSSMYTQTPASTTLFIDQASDLDEPVSSRYKAEKL